MKDEKRYSRSYKSQKQPYKKAMARAKKEKVKLSNIMENVLIAYSEGWDVKAVKLEAGKGFAMDIFTQDFAVNLSKITK